MRTLEKLSILGVAGIMNACGGCEAFENPNKTEVVIAEKGPVGVEREKVRQCVLSVESDGKGEIILHRDSGFGGATTETHHFAPKNIKISITVNSPNCGKLFK